jgi:hypothetical protein
MNLNKTAKQNLMYIGVIILVLMLLPKISKLFEGYEKGNKKVRDERQDVGLLVDKQLIGPSPVNKGK